MSHEPTEREVIKAQVNRAEVVEHIAQAIPEDGTTQVLPGLYFNCVSIPTQPHSGVSEPTFCVIAQGSKEVLLGDNRYRYDPAHYLLPTVELPTISQVIDVSKEQPYLSLRLKLDPNLVSSVIIEAGQPSSRNQANVRAIDVSPLDANLLDAVVRLVRLLDAPCGSSDSRTTDYTGNYLPTFGGGTE